MNFAKSVLGLGNPSGYSSRPLEAETVFEDDEYENHPIEVITAPTSSSNNLHHDYNNNNQQHSINANNIYLNSLKHKNPQQHSTPSDSTSLPLLTLIGLNLNGAPFSALTSSMWPQDIPMEEDLEDGDLDFRYDEFGFKVEEEDGPEECSNKLLSEKFVEDPKHRSKWVSFLEFSHNDSSLDLTWDNIQPRLATSEKLKLMLRQGIPHSLRPQLWMRISGAMEKKAKMDTSYKMVVKASSNDHLMTSKQIEKDLLRTMPTNACFCSINSTGIPRLRRVLRAIAWLFPDIGYCQGTGMILSSLLLFMEEEEAFWTMCTIVDDLLPASYYSNTLIGVQADQKVLRQLVVSYLPEIDNKLKEFDIELTLVTLHWFMTVFASVVHTRVLLRIWDVFFYDGSIVLFLVTLAMLKLREKDILEADNSAQIFNVLSNIPSEVQDADELIQAAFGLFGSLTDVCIDVQRRKHLAHLMAEEGCLINPESTKNLPKQHLTKRHLKSSKSLVFWRDGKGEEGGGSLESWKVKNIKQTEILVDLRYAILQVARHFQALDPENSSISLQADYKMESHSRDLEQFVSVSGDRPKRAKALLDFERHDEDELGFRKNDVITIISQKDDHCWIGEMNGLTGWFPAKFVEVLDERSKHYTSAGDDSVSEAVTDIVRGVLCPALKAVFEHGLKRPSFTGVCHPWMFIEQAAMKEVEKDFESVYSRLVLCKTYKLDEDGKVLTPEEILYRAVHSVNLTHDAVHAQMDVKFRSLMCCGLNEQALHLWLETLCSCSEVVQKWYYPWSFIRSPGWVQIKCELRILNKLSFHLSTDWELPHHDNLIIDGLCHSVADALAKHHLFSWDLTKRIKNQHRLLAQFAFKLSNDWELPVNKDSGRPLRDGISDMIVKHHLFSWDI